MSVPFASLGLSCFVKTKVNDVSNAILSRGTYESSCVALHHIQE